MPRIGHAGLPIPSIAFRAGFGLLPRARGISLKRRRPSKWEGRTGGNR
jgi:hypothetical protein